MATTTEKIQTLRCQHGEGHDWTRLAQVGKPPRFCPEHKSAPVVKLAARIEKSNAEIDRFDEEAAAKLAKAREAAAKAREERKAREAREAIENAKAELARIIATMPETEAAYETAFDKANRTNKLEDWRAADGAQSRIIGMIVRRRALERTA